MPDNEPDANLTELTESEEEQPEKYTDEWYDSVEQRFRDLGDYIKSMGKGGRARAKQAATEASAAPDTGQSAPDAEGNGTISAPVAVHDTRPPKPTHVYFRRLGGD